MEVLPISELFDPDAAFQAPVLRDSLTDRGERRGKDQMRYVRNNKIGATT